jgi:hypothetical protein
MRCCWIRDWYTFIRVATQLRVTRNDICIVTSLARWVSIRCTRSRRSFGRDRLGSRYDARRISRCVWMDPDANYNAKFRKSRFDFVRFVVAEEIDWIRFWERRSFTESAAGAFCVRLCL